MSIGTERYTLVGEEGATQRRTLEKKGRVGVPREGAGLQRRVDSRDALFVFIHPPTPRTTPFSATHLSRGFFSRNPSQPDTGFCSRTSTSCARPR